MRLRPRTGRDEQGVTLVEMLIAIVLLSIITVPLGGALWLFFRNSDDTTRRMSESHDVQIASAYFATDVQSIGTRDWSAYPYVLRQSVEVDVAPTTGVNPCGTAGTPNAVIRLAWDEATAGGTPAVIAVSYAPRLVGGEHQLRRIQCRNAVVQSDIVIVHNVDTVSPPVCSSACTAAPAIPQSIQLGLRIKAPGNDGVGITIVLSGQRRTT
jgi:prepilin-type N-terminal cleavage/methylation domain-containing protein